MVYMLLQVRRVADAHAVGISAVHCPGPELLASGDEDGCIKLWDLREKNMVRMECDNPWDLRARAW